MNDKVYFKNLNGFRFIAAMMVIVCHLELFKERVGLPNSWRHPLIFEAGSAGVDFFFVLSGFLITMLLLVEKHRYGTIALKNFYMRRILRIWPLYFLVVLLCFLVVPHIGIFHIDGYSQTMNVSFAQKFMFSMLLMPNVALAFYGEMPYAAPLWSIGVEEQFYLLWPLLILLFRVQWKMIIAFIALFIVFKGGLFLLDKESMLDNTTYTSVKNFIVGLRMECMGIGGLGAYLYYKKAPIVAFITHNMGALVATVWVLPVMYFSSQLYEMHHIILSLLFITIILNGATKRHTFINLEGKLFYSLGTVSFGLYLWHPLCIGASLWIMDSLQLWSHDAVTANTAYYSMAIGLTVALSYTSYYYFERRFLNLKKKYTVVRSGDEARGELTRRATGWMKEEPVPNF